MKRLFFLISFILLVPSLFSQQIRYVKPSAQSSAWAQMSSGFVFSNLQSAIDASVSGDQVWVAVGIYYPSLGIDGNTGRFRSFLMKDGVAVHGGFSGTENSLNERNRVGDELWTYANPVILSGDYNQNGDSTDNVFHVVWFGTEDLSDTTLLEGVIVEKGYANGTLANDQKGGGVFITKKGALRNCVVRYNVGLNGGGIFCEGNARIFDCYIHHNQTWTQNGFGGGLHCNSSTQYIENCLFENNWAAKDGGAIHGGINTEIQNSTFMTNSATQNGGAIFSMNGQKHGGCIFKYNQANQGGALFSSYNNNTIYSSLFSANQAVNGGAVYLGTGTSGHKIHNSLFTNNEAELAGAIWSGSDLILANTTIVRNKAYVAGGFSGTATDKIYNTIIWGNEANAYPQISGEVTASYSAIEGILLSGDHNIMLPEGTTDSVFFLRPASLKGLPLTLQEHADVNQANYEILALSVCRDAGTVTIPNFQFPAVDLKGNNRINGQTDMGAYELWCNTSASFDLFSNPPFAPGEEIEIMIADFDSEFEYEINFGDSSLPMNVLFPSLSYVYDSAGTFTILLSVTDTVYFCESIYSEEVEIILPNTSISENLAAMFSIYPNPSSDVVNVVCPFENVDMIVYDEVGKKVDQYNLFNQTNSINIKNWKSGVYFILFQSETKELHYFLKFIKR